MSGCPVSDDFCVAICGESTFSWLAVPQINHRKQKTIHIKPMDLVRVFPCIYSKTLFKNAQMSHQDQSCAATGL